MTLTLTLTGCFQTRPKQAMCGCHLCATRRQKRGALNGTTSGSWADPPAAPSELNAPASLKIDDEPPATFMWNGSALLATRRKTLQSKPPAGLQLVLAQLRQDAKRLASKGPFSVMQKATTPASDSKHDYMSLGASHFQDLWLSLLASGTSLIRC